MKLATRCNGCGTLFGVVRDQLWVSGGWVRCGRCSRAFNTFDQLYDLTQGRPPAWLGAQPAAPEKASLDETQAPEPIGVAEVAALETHEALAAAPTSDEFTAIPTDVEADARLDTSVEESTSGASTEQAVDAERGPIASAEIEPSDLHFAGEARDEVLPPPDPVLAVVPGADDDSPSGEMEPAPVAIEQPAHAARDELSAPERPVDDAPAFAPRASTPVAATPEFLRRAEKQARWSRPSVRLALGSLALAALLMLTLQAALHFRHGLAAESPRARHALTWLCTNLGCTIEAPRRIADLTVESSMLTRVPGNDRLIRLSLTLRNRGRVALAMPALDLTLKDSTGRVLVRRAIRPDDVPAAPATLATGVDVPLQLLVATDGRQIAAYTVEIFYP